LFGSRDDLSAYSGDEFVEIEFEAGLGLDHVDDPPAFPILAAMNGV
jgi:hypothetical protein